MDTQSISDLPLQTRILPTGCHKFFLYGYPTFYEVFSNSSPGFIVLTVFLTIAVITNISLYSYGIVQTQSKNSNKITSRFSKYILRMNASLPVVLGVCSYVTAMAPRLYGMVNIFSSLFFVFSMDSFSRMVFEYFGGLDECVKRLAEREHEFRITGKSGIPLLTCCGCCIKPRKIKSKNDPTLKIVKMMIIQNLVVTFFTHFLDAAILLDGSICTNGKPNKTVLTTINYIFSSVDLISSLIAVTALSILNSNTIIFLTKQNLKQKFAMFRLCLLFFRIQPAILKLFQALLGKTAPIGYSETAWVMSVNSYCQVFEFLIVSVLMWAMLKRSGKVKETGGDELDLDMVVGFRTEIETGLQMDVSSRREI